MSGAGLAAAQSFTAGVRGAVRESGAVVPGVTIQLINEGTGTVRETVSNAVGEYDFSAVPPGAYTVRAALQGFKTFERTGVRVATQQFVRTRAETSCPTEPYVICCGDGRADDTREVCRAAPSDG